MARNPRNFENMLLTIKVMLRITRGYRFRADEIIRRGHTEVYRLEGKN